MVLMVSLDQLVLPELQVFRVMLALPVQRVKWALLELLDLLALMDLLEPRVTMV
jgi:hypothetical protein